MAITTNIKNYAKSHNNGNGGGTTVIMGGGNANIPADLNVTTITAAKGDIGILNGVTMSYDDGQFIYLGAGQGQVLKLNGSELNYETGIINDLTSDKIKAGKIDADEINATKAWLETLNSKYITTEYLTVTKQAHFFELIIDKVRSVGGTLMMTQAQCVVDYAKAVDSNGDYLDYLDDVNAAYYDVFWLAQESNGRKVTNDWVVNDQAYCQSFNNVSAGVNYDVSNKYYWRLVTGILNDRYMNLNTGAELPLSQSAQASVNAVTIDTPRISYTAEEVNNVVNTDWNTVAQTISGVITGASWNQTSGGAGVVTQGTMTTTNTVFGIQLTPIADSLLSISVPEKFILDCSKSRLNIGIYYTNGGSEWFPAPETPSTHYEYNLTTDYTIEAVVITNADEVEWKLVHGIRLSNTDCDNMLSGYASIPSVGDNIAQLGYRWQGANDPNEKSRGNAIIIAAYKTPDNGTGVQDDFAQYPIKPPSYAQYEAIASNSSYRFDLAHYRKTFMDANGSKFIGDLYAGDGTSIEDLIDDATQVQYYLHIAYANSADGQTDFAKIPAVGVSYSYMGFCSDTNASDATLTYSDYEWSMVPGGTGTNGGHWEYAYKNTQDPDVAPNVLPSGTSVSDLPYDGWYATPQTLQDGYYTWMSQCFVSGATGQYGEWRTPIRLTGEDGQPGTDGNSIEFIYTRNNTGVAPAAPPTNTTYPDDWSGTDSNGVTWTDNPQGVSANMMWEYVCQRIKSNGTWGNYEPNPAAVWSKWGEKGQDGDGYEYIYKHFPTEQTFGSDNSNPAYWAANQNDDYLGPTGYEWSDDPVGVDTTDKYEYVAVRKKTSGTWGTFSTPTLWSRYAAQGADGGRYVSMYGIGTSSTQAPYSIPYVAASISTMTSMGWSTTMPAQEENKFIWMTEAFFASNATTAMWSNPIRLTGDNGKAGEDGNSQEFIYKHFTDIQDWSQISTNANPANWPTNQSDDYVGPSGYQWSDNPTGVDSTNKYEYVSVREYKVHSGTTKTWGAFTTPKLWSNWGEKGQDGDGWEYIFKHFTTEQTFVNDNNNPAYWTANQTDDYVGPSGYQWSDDPVGVTSEYKFEYVAVRKKENGTWGQFNTPTLWSRYSAQGADGGRYIFMYQNYAASNPPSIVPNGSTSYTVAQLTNAGWTYTATTPNFANGEYTYMTQAFFADQQTSSVWTVPTRITGDNGQPGEDGKYTEFIYKRFTTEQTFGNNNNNPAYWAANQTEDYLGPSGYQWSDNPTGITSTYKFEYMAEREYDGNNFGKFTTPVIWSRWGEKGQDGDGYEYIYKAFATAQTFGNDNNNPAYWSANQSDDYVGPSGYQWSDDPVELNDSTAKYEYVAVRKKTSGTWGKFSTPEIWALYGGQGPQGPQGPTGPQGYTGDDGANAIVYKLIDQGSRSYVHMTLDNSNNISSELAISVKVKVMRIEGSSMRYMTVAEMRDWRREGSSTINGFYAYVFHSKSSTANTDYSYNYRCDLNTSDGDSADAIFTYTYTSTNSGVISNNKEIIIKLIESNSSSIYKTSSTLNYTRDTLSIETTLLPNATLQVLQGQEASIATLVTGQSQNAQEISNVKQTANQISARVTTIEGDYVTGSELTQTADSIKSEVYQKYDPMLVQKSQMVDLMNLDTTKFYPVSIKLRNNQKYQRIRVSRGLDEATYGAGPSQYGNHANSNNGFVVDLDWNAMASGWGTNWQPNSYPTNTDWSSAYYVGQAITAENRFVARYIIKYYTAWTKTQVVGNNTIPLDHIAGHLEQNFMSDEEIVYLRGGSKYLIDTDWNGSTIELWPSGYSWSYATSGTTYTCVRPVISYTDFWINPTDEQTRSEIQQTADSITANVYDTIYNQTGINIRSGIIELNANNTVINGSLKIRDAQEGLIIYNDQNQKAVEVVKDTIGTFNQNLNRDEKISSGSTLCTYVVGTNGNYRQYLTTFNSEKGYMTENGPIYNDGQECGCRMYIGEMPVGSTINVSGFNIKIGGYFGNYNSYTGQYAGHHEDIYASGHTWQAKLKLRSVYSSQGNDYIWAETSWFNLSHTSNYFYNNSLTLSHTVTAQSKGNFELYLEVKGPNPEVAVNTRYKFINISGEGKLSGTVAFNTKIGTDGLRSISENHKLWVNQSQMTQLYYNTDVSLYGDSYKAYGYTVGSNGVGKTFGGNLNSSSLHIWDSTNALLRVSSSYSGNVRSKGKVAWNFSGNIDGAWRSEFCYNYVDYTVMPKYVVLENLISSYSNQDGYFTFLYYTSEQLPIGTEVVIINHTGRTLHVAAHRSLPYNMYPRNSASATNKIDIGNGQVSSFVCIGGNTFKQLHLI